MIKVPPCKDCERKGCGAYHAECKPYMEWRKERDITAETYKKSKEMYGLLDGIGKTKRKR